MDGHAARVDRRHSCGSHDGQFLFRGLPDIAQERGFACACLPGEEDEGIGGVYIRAGKFECAIIHCSAKIGVLWLRILAKVI